MMSCSLGHHSQVSANNIAYKVASLSVAQLGARLHASLKHSLRPLLMRVHTILLFSRYRYHVRPSALLSVVQAAGVAAGAAAAFVPATTRDAAIAALQESLTDLNNDNLRLLREAGLSDEVGQQRQEARGQRQCCRWTLYVSLQRAGC